MHKSVSALVIGGGIGGLTAAFELAKAGILPTVIEERGKVGGLIAQSTIGSLTFDIGAESFAVRATKVSDLCGELGLELAHPNGGSWVYSHLDGGFTAPIAHGILGIPASLTDPGVLSMLSESGLARAQQDLTTALPPNYKVTDLASLVTDRLGEEALNRLVRPVAGGIHAADPADLSVAVVAPGLPAALQETGSLIRAVAQLRGTVAKPAVCQPVGGMYRLVSALSEHIIELGGQVQTRVKATGITPQGRGWLISLQPQPGRSGDISPTSQSSESPDQQPHTLYTECLVVALPGAGAIKLLSDMEESFSNWDLPTGTALANVSLVVSDPRLDAGPRGSGLLVSSGAREQGIKAKALTHYSFKWSWLAKQAQLQGAKHLHALRVSYGRPGELAPTPTLAQALADASTLLGIDLSTDQLVEGRVIHWGPSLPPPTPAHRERVGQVNTILASHGALAVTGAWVAGSGIGMVVPHAKKVAQELITRLK